MNFLKNFKLTIFFSVIIFLPSAQADLLNFALSGYCDDKDIIILQSETISPPTDFNLKELNPDAVDDLYKKNMSSIVMEFRCNALILMSEAEIKAGFKNKPKGPVGTFTDEAWVGLREKYPGVSGVLRLSQAGYSIDHTYAILYMASSCDSLCGYVYFIQYKLVNGSWVYDKRVLVAKS